MLFKRATTAIIQRKTRFHCIVYFQGSVGSGREIELVVPGGITYLGRRNGLIAALRRLWAAKRPLCGWARKLSLYVFHDKIISSKRKGFSGAKSLHCGK